MNYNQNIKKQHYSSFPMYTNGIPTYIKIIIVDGVLYLNKKVLSKAQIKEGEKKTI
jgi:hypothetical protein